MTIQANTFLSANFDHCYAEGFKASQAENTVEANPFQLGSKEAHYWQEGWWDAFYNAEPRFAIQGQPVATNDGWFSKLRQHRWPVVGSMLGLSVAAVSWAIFEAAA